MKTEQFQYVLELYKTGSISKAAKKFYMSRPNLSNSIRSLEDELGFEILERGVNGVKFTEKGMTFVRHCMSIVKELEEVRALADEKSRLQFGVVNPNYPPVENAFLRLCREVEGQTELRVPVRKHDAAEPEKSGPCHYSQQGPPGSFSAPGAAGTEAGVPADL